MIISHGWYFPDGETHLPGWLDKAGLPLNGRTAYQGAKQLACYEEILRWGCMRRALDVGAHVGLWSYNLAHWFDRVDAFEPVEAHRACFRKNVTSPKVTLYPCALGERDGCVSIKAGVDSTGDSYVDIDALEPDVPMMSIDGAKYQDVDFIKIDTEGYEEFVLRGAKDTIARCRPVICVEQKRQMATERFGLPALGAVKLLQGLAYQVAREISGDYIMVPRRC